MEAILGEFDTEEKNFHINVLEPMAARFRLQALVVRHQTLMSY